MFKGLRPLIFCFIHDKISVSFTGTGGIGVGGTASANVNYEDLSTTGEIHINVGTGVTYGVSGSATIDIQLFEIGDLSVNAPVSAVNEGCIGAVFGVCGSVSVLENGSVASATFSFGFVSGGSYTSSLVVNDPVASVPVFSGP